MSRQNTIGFDPFSRHRGKVESQPKPDLAETAAPVAAGTNSVEAAGITQKTEAETRENSPDGAKPVGSKSLPATRTSNPFSRHGGEPKDRPEPERRKSPPPAQELLVWIQQCWNKPTISLRDIQVYAPGAIRDRETATRHAETLEKYGWLAPVRPRRRDRRVWRLPPAGATVIPD